MTSIDPPNTPDPATLNIVVQLAKEVKSLAESTLAISQLVTSISEMQVKMEARLTEIECSLMKIEETLDKGTDQDEDVQLLGLKPGAAGAAGGYVAELLENDLTLVVPKNHAKNRF